LVERILIVGLGSIGKRHLRLARELLPHADIRVLRHQECTTTPEYSNGCFSGIDQAAEFAPHITVIANPAPFHIALAQRLADTGSHLLVEKPIAACEDGIARLLESVHERGTVLLTGYNLRYLPSLQKFRDLLGANEIGRVISVRCEIGQYLPSWRPDTDYRQSVSARSELGGGALLELSHEIDYLRWIFGEIENVTARISRQSSLDIDVEDTAHLIIGFAPAEDGRALIGNLNMDLVRHDTTRFCCAIGENGSLRWNGLTGVVEKFEAGAKEWREHFCHQHQRDDSYLAEWRHFLECINGQAAPLITGEDGLRVLQIIDAARQSSETGRQTQVAGKSSNAKVSACKQ
jgi:predicted dehydrogenase